MTTPRKTTKKTTRLKRSKLENLFRHANGVYWVHAKVNGKPVERSLRTSDYNLAATLLPETLKELKGASEAHNADSLVGAIQTEADRENPDLKPTTRHYYQQIAKSIIDTLAGSMGHKDGGILAAQTHGHLIPDHSSKEAGKVRFPHAFHEYPRHKALSPPLCPGASLPHSHTLSACASLA